MSEGKQVIAIDGPAGSGKSTIARLLASKIGFLYLDSGAFYRGLTLALWEVYSKKNDDPEKFSFFAESLADAALLEKEKSSFGFSLTEIPLHCELSPHGTNQIFLANRDITDDIRTLEITKLIRYIAPHRAFREYVNAKIRDFAKNHNLVMDGRDIGTDVFPKTKYKFFLTASADVRANRRHAELLGKGIKTDLSHLKEEIIARDMSDETRTVAPLRQASDAILIDTSESDTETVLNTILSRLNLPKQI
ncbi:MAG: (d)CMP kinase [Leptospira sp.]|nr:(d)CMP kinase [Leptospira sp.]